MGIGRDEDVRKRLRSTGEDEEGLRDGVLGKDGYPEEVHQLGDVIDSQ